MASLTCTFNIPRKSLNIPVPTVQFALDAYTQHPDVVTLNQIMLPYLGMEEILYSQSYEQFETRQTLNTLAIRFQLPAAITFKQLLKSYDMQYATVRSFLYNNRTPKEILYQAAKEGDIQAFYNQLKLYPELRFQDYYTYALQEVAEVGHKAIIDLLIELGANPYVIPIGAASGGHLDIFKDVIDKANLIGKTLPLADSAQSAAENNRMEVLDYILSINPSKAVLSYAMEGACTSGNAAMIEYLIAKGGDDYVALIQGATRGDHFDLFKQYYSKVKTAKLYYTFRLAIDNLRLDVLEFLLEKGVIETDILQQTLIDYKREYKICGRQLNALKPSSKDLAELVRNREKSLSIIEYFECHGVTNKDSYEESSD